jgi:NAD(P)H-nitrite reductase large subunit
MALAGRTCHTRSLAAADVQDHSDADQDILCYCEWLTRDEIIAAMPRVRTLKELRETTRACTTCFGCEGDLDELVAMHHDLLGSAL